MPVNVEVKLGETTYTVPRMNIGQIERITELPAGKMSFGALRIALERAEPKVADFGAIEATSQEVIEAARAVLRMSGMAKDAEPGESKPPETTPSPGGDIGTASSGA